jgi:DNA-binding response OmpR family regulator
MIANNNSTWRKSLNAAGSDQPLEGTRVLIAEDSAIQAFDLKLFLEGAGAEVFGPASTVAHAAAIAASGHVTAAVLDVVLHGECIFPAARILEELGAAIVFYTASTGLEELRREWPKAGVVSKPAPFELVLKELMMARQKARSF